jgi:hypothetical protein
MGELRSYSKMKITIKTDTTYKYLQVFNGILGLTDKELLVLSKFVDLGETVNLCSAKNKKLVADDLKVKDPNTLNNYVKRLKDKGAITQTKDGYTLSKLLKKTNLIEIVKQ